MSFVSVRRISRTEQVVGDQFLKVASVSSSPRFIRINLYIIQAGPSGNSKSDRRFWQFQMRSSMHDKRNHRGFVRKRFSVPIHVCRLFGDEILDGDLSSEFRFRYERRPALLEFGVCVVVGRAGVGVRPVRCGGVRGAGGPPRSLSQSQLTIRHFIP